MPIFLLLAAGLGIVLLAKGGKPNSTNGGSGAVPSGCPVPQETMRSIMAPILLPLLDPTGPQPTVAAVNRARALVVQLDACGQHADAELFREGIFGVTKNPKDAPKGPRPS